MRFAFGLLATIFWPIVVAAPARAQDQSVAAGSAHALGILATGTVAAWGYNDEGQLGDGTTTARDAPVPVVGLGSDVEALAAGGAHSMALMTDGTIREWGDNGSGELGDGTTTDRHSPITVAGLTDVTAIAAGPSNSAVVAGGDVYVWGANQLHQVGDGTTVRRTEPTAVAGLSGTFIAVAEGESHTLALTSGGHVWSWGDNDFGELGRSKSIGGEEPALIVGLSNIVQIAAYGNLSIALDASGHIWTWGWDYRGELGRPCMNQTCNYNPDPGQVTGSGYKSIAAGENHALAITANDTVVGWGLDTDGEIGDGVAPVQHNSPVAATGLTNVTAIAAGQAHSVAARSTGGIEAWGDGSNGQVGDGTLSKRYSPVPIQLDDDTTAPNGFCQGGVVHHAIASTDRTVFRTYETAGDHRGPHLWTASFTAYGYDCHDGTSDVLVDFQWDTTPLFDTTIENQWQVQRTFGVGAAGAIYDIPPQTQWLCCPDLEYLPNLPVGTAIGARLATFAMHPLANPNPVYPWSLDDTTGGLIGDFVYVY